MKSDVKKKQKKKKRYTIQNGYRIFKKALRSDG